MTKSILLVDDDDSIRRNYYDILIDGGYIAAEYGSVESGIKAIEDNAFDLVLLDISINGDRAAGHKMCKWLKSRYPQLPVVMLTSLDNEQNRTIATENGADAYWLKSACIDDLINDVNAFIAERAD